LSAAATPLAIETNSQDFHGLFTLYMAIAVVVAVLVLGSLAFAVIRYRRRDDRGPREVKGLKPLEAIWVGLIAVVVVVLVVSTFRTEDRVDAVSSDPAQTVHVLAFQWGWRFSYPRTGISRTGTGENPPTLVVPADVPVRFDLRSRDVIHSFFIPELKFKRDAFPNRTTTFDLVFDPGVTTVGHCAEFCGLGHDDMDFQVAAMSSADFHRWLQSQERPGGGSA
jgi:cytochrome c oxidase subunit II